MNNFGLVSIITPSYNSADFIIETIESILAQTYTNWELLITDDCSTDNTSEIVYKYTLKDKRIKFFQLTKNSGAGIARNNSIKEAKGDYIAFCDSDDCWLPEKLEKQLEFMEQHNCSFSYTSYYTCEEDGTPKGKIMAPSRISYFDLICNDNMGCLTTIYNAKILGKHYMPTIRKRQDWGYKLIIIQKSKYAYGIKECLAKYRLRNNSLSANKMGLIKYNINVYKEVLHYSTFKSYFIFIFLFMPSYIWKKIKNKINNKL